MPGPYWVYVLRSLKTGRHYTGSCQDPQARLNQHNGGVSKATRHGIPWVVVHTESHPTRSAAMRRERFLKTGTGREEVRRLVAR